MDKKGEMDSLQPNLEGADRARSSEERARARMCVCVCCLFVHMYDSSVDVAVLPSFAAEVNQQVQVCSVMTCSYR